MSEQLPKRRIDELITRWQLTSVRAVVVEGPGDEEMIGLVQKEAHCPPPLASIEVWSSDMIDIPPELMASLGFDGVGAKQRVVAFSREVERDGSEEGFRGIVDRDLDSFVGIDHQSAALLYTDHSCMTMYFWSPEILRRVLIHFRCNAKIETIALVRRLFGSICAACKKVSAVRICALRHLGWEVSLHQSDKSLTMADGVLQLDLSKFLLQCGFAKGVLEALKGDVDRIVDEIAEVDPLDLINDHDLIWLTTFALRELSSLSRHAIDEDLVGRSLLVLGTMDPKLPSRALFANLADWAAA